MITVMKTYKNISIKRSVSFNRRTLSTGSPRFSRLSWVSRWFQVLVVIGSLISFIVAFCCGYFYVLPSLSQAFHGYSISKSDDSVGSCNVFDGTWVADIGYPLYNATECPFVERGFDCLGNGRRDKDYLKWRWKPKNCNIPEFDVHSILEKLRGKRVVFVGDSMSRTQWESLICLLMTGVEDKKSVYEVNGNKITKQIRFLGVRFSTFNLTIEFFRSVFLVQQGSVPRHAPKRVKSTLKLDKLDDISKQWVNSDVLIFNTGQWWVPGKLFSLGCYFQVGNIVKLGMPIPTAFRIAIGTWASWVEENIDTGRTHVFFRTFEPSHWSNLTRRICKVTQNPVVETKGREQSILTDTVLEVVSNMTIPVNTLHITSMTAFRSDAHVGNWSDNPSVPDCSHWCLPGVPDVWNEIFLSYLFIDNGLPLH
ncbi:protein trichome berefringence-like 7 [Ziziphus jujuba]|uniref:Protein trichome berefringence-like 7 n=1 Tax=Ziziphus jujuba TaxID=326968 RepID=A0A6P4A6F6_ZIZJJ|nr:protein trichome berefringence-like 7 [Ziziphus jujuba]XP_015891202.2 protein trichome berefringence-like 7 [Ziziphus jujuba]XP_024931893.2 protein trichome berefringence-like 7 [Ziziphus jujuba]